MNARKMPITDVHEVLALMAQCNECQDEEFTDVNGSGDRRAFLDRLHSQGWIQTEQFGLICKKCAVTLGVIAK